MSLENAKKFFDMVEKDRSLLAQLASGTKDWAAFLERSVVEAKRHGLEFSDSEASQLLRPPGAAHDGELSQEQLDAVAGGAGAIHSSMAGAFLISWGNSGTVESVPRDLNIP